MNLTLLAPFLGSALIVCIVVVIVVAARARLHTVHSPQRRVCGGCGYDVEDSMRVSPRCPECGGVLAEVGVVDPRSIPPRKRAIVFTLVGLALLTLIAAWSGLAAYHSGRQLIQAAKAADAAEMAARQRAEQAILAALETSLKGTDADQAGQASGEPGLDRDARRVEVPLDDERDDLRE